MAITRWRRRRCAGSGYRCRKWTRAADRVEDGCGPDRGPAAAWDGWRPQKSNASAPWGEHGRRQLHNKTKPGSGHRGDGKAGLVWLTRLEDERSVTRSQKSRLTADHIASANNDAVST